MTDQAARLQAKRDELERLESEWAAARLTYAANRDGLLAEIRELRLSQPPKERKRPVETLRASTQAGAANMVRVREALRENGRMTQARLCEVTGINSGTMTWAIRALLEEGAVRETGKVGRSREVELRRKRVTTALPGS